MRVEAQAGTRSCGPSMLTSFGIYSEHGGCLWGPLSRPCPDLCIRPLQSSRDKEDARDVLLGPVLRGQVPQSL